MSNEFESQVEEKIFEGKIKIRYGYDDYKEGWININPLNHKYYADNKQGVDYKFKLEDIPLFWKDRIEKIDINQNINEELNTQYFLHSILKMVYSDVRYNPYIDEEIKNKVLNTYLQTHKKYSLV